MIDPTEDELLETLTQRWSQIDEELLTELVEKGEGDYIVAWNKWIWRFEDTDFTEDEEESVKEIAEVLGIDEIEGITEWSDLQDVLREERPDVLQGIITGDELEINDSSQWTFDPKSSVLVKKVVNHLGLEGVNVSDEYDTSFSHKEDIKGNTPDGAYHGSASDYLYDILRIGIRPLQTSGVSTNYDEVEHYSRIFFTTHPKFAGHHANNAASGGRGDKKGKGLPIVFGFTIPDKSKLTADYDIDTMSSMTHYDYLQHMQDKHRQHSSIMSGSSQQLSREFGVYGYEGWIPPKYIHTLWINPSPEDYKTNLNNWEEFDIRNKEELARAIQFIESMGHEWRGEDRYEEYLYDVDWNKLMSDMVERIDDPEDYDAVMEVAEELAEEWGIDDPYILVRKYEEIQ